MSAYFGQLWTSLFSYASCATLASHSQREPQCHVGVSIVSWQLALMKVTWRCTVSKWRWAWKAGRMTECTPSLQSRLASQPTVFQTTGQQEEMRSCSTKDRASCASIKCHGGWKCCNTKSSPNSTNSRYLPNPPSASVNQSSTDPKSSPIQAKKSRSLSQADD